MTDTNLRTDESSTTQLDERRKNPRRPPSFAQVFVWVGKKTRVKARVIDESDEGVGLHVPFGTSLQVGSKIRVEMGEATRWGTVRWATIRQVTDMQNGCLMAGVQWDFILS